MEIFVSIGARIREVRKGMGLSQAEFAEIAASAGVAGATRQSQANYEKGKQMPAAPYLAAIGSAGADVQYILTGSHSAGVLLSPDEQLLLDRFRKSPPELREAALRVLLGDAKQASQRKFKEVGQYIEGAVNQAGMTLNVGGKREK
ncbi:TPA: helix-turn-helix domain-containing protein [Pseudomonas aeruginosa]